MNRDLNYHSFVVTDANQVFLKDLSQVMLIDKVKKIFFQNYFYVFFSGVVRGVAGVAKATPIFQILFNKKVTKISQKFFYLL